MFVNLQGSINYVGGREQTDGGTPAYAQKNYECRKSCKRVCLSPFLPQLPQLPPPPPHISISTFTSLWLSPSLLPSPSRSPDGHFWKSSQPSFPSQPKPPPRALQEECREGANRKPLRVKMLRKDEGKKPKRQQCGQCSKTMASLVRCFL